MVGGGQGGEGDAAVGGLEARSEEVSRLIQAQFDVHKEMMSRQEMEAEKFGDSQRAGAAGPSKLRPMDAEAAPSHHKIEQESPPPGSLKQRAQGVLSALIPQASPRPLAPLLCPLPSHTDRRPLTFPNSIDPPSLRVYLPSFLSIAVSSPLCFGQPPPLPCLPSLPLSLSLACFSSSFPLPVLDVSCPNSPSLSSLSSWSLSSHVLPSLTLSSLTPLAHAPRHPRLSPHGSSPPSTCPMISLVLVLLVNAGGCGSCHPAQSVCESVCRRGKDPEDHQGRLLSLFVLLACRGGDNVWLSWRSAGCRCLREPWEGLQNP